MNLSIQSKCQGNHELHGLGEVAFDAWVVTMETAQSSANSKCITALLSSARSKAIGEEIELVSGHVRSPFGGEPYRPETALCGERRSPLGRARALCVVKGACHA